MFDRLFFINWSQVRRMNEQATQMERKKKSSDGGEMTANRCGDGKKMQRQRQE